MLFHYSSLLKHTEQYFVQNVVKSSQLPTTPVTMVTVHNKYPGH